MGVLATVVKTETGDYEEIVQTVEAHYGENKFCDQFAPSGEDAPPLKDDLVALMEVEGTGNMASVGVLAKSQGAKPGEKIIYSRNENGEVVAKIHLKNDGSVDFSGQGNAELTVAGSLTLIVKGDANLTVEGKSSCVIKGDANLTVEGKTEVKSKGVLDIKSDDNISITAGNGLKNVEISALKFSVNKTDFEVGV